MFYQNGVWYYKKIDKKYLLANIDTHTVIITQLLILALHIIYMYMLLQKYFHMINYNLPMYNIVTLKCMLYYIKMYIYKHILM